VLSYDGFHKCCCCVSPEEGPKGPKRLVNRQNKGDRDYQLRLRVYIWEVYIQVTQQDAPHKNKIHIFIVPNLEALSTWRARSPYLYPPGTGWPSYTPAHWVPFPSPLTTRRATVEVFEPSNTRERSMSVEWSQLINCELSVECFESMQEILFVSRDRTGLQVMLFLFCARCPLEPSQVESVFCELVTGRLVGRNHSHATLGPQVAALFTATKLSPDG
jgi:hypothetical protein